MCRSRRAPSCAARSSARRRRASAPLPRPRSSITFSDQLSRRGAPGLSQPGTRRVVPGGLSHPAGTRTETFHAAARRHLKLSGVPVETSKGEWGRGQHELKSLFRGARHGGPARVFKQCLKELAEAAGMSLTFMRNRRDARARAAISTQPVARRQERLSGAAVRPRQGLGSLQVLPGRLDRARARRDGVYGPTVNSYSAMSTRRGADAARGSYDNRTAASAWSAKARACASNAAFRAPTAILPRVAASLASGLDGIANRLSLPMLRRDILRGEKPAARALYAFAGRGRVRAQRFAKRAFATKSSALHATSTAAKRPPRQGRHVGNAKGTSKEYETQRQVALITARQRHRTAIGAPVFEGRRAILAPT